jgi:hypothetical protein
MCGVLRYNSEKNRMEDSLEFEKSRKFNIELCEIISENIENFFPQKLQ